MAAVSRPYIRERVNMGTVREMRTGIRKINAMIADSIWKRPQPRWRPVRPGEGSFRMGEFLWHDDAPATGGVQAGWGVSRKNKNGKLKHAPPRCIGSDPPETQ